MAEGASSELSAAHVASSAADSILDADSNLDAGAHLKGCLHDVSVGCQVVDSLCLVWWLTHSALCGG
jgi:hypothetical protein